MEEQEVEALGFEIASDVQNKVRQLEGDKKQRDANVLRFLDSMDSYLTLFDSLSSTLRQGWLDLASARHSMGVSRVNGVLLDLKLHSAATSLQVTQHDDDVDDDSAVKQPQFTLRKWGSLGNEKCSSEEQNSKNDSSKEKLGSPNLRNRSNSRSSVSPWWGVSYFVIFVSGERTSANGAPLEVDDQIEKERSKSLSVFGTLVSPKLRAAQLSFETALETLVEIANMRSAMLSTFSQVHEDLEVSKG